MSSCLLLNDESLALKVLQTHLGRLITVIGTPVANSPTAATPLANTVAWMRQVVGSKGSVAGHG